MLEVVNPPHRVVEIIIEAIRKGCLVGLGEGVDFPVFAGDGAELSGYNFVCLLIHNCRHDGAAVASEEAKGNKARAGDRVTLVADKEPKERYGSGSDDEEVAPPVIWRERVTSNGVKVCRYDSDRHDHTEEGDKSGVEARHLLL